MLDFAIMLAYDSYITKMYLEADSVEDKSFARRFVFEC